MNRKDSITFILTAMMIFGCCASCKKAPASYECTDSIGCVRIDPQDPVRIGILQALSGKVAPLGLEQIRGFELAFDERGGKIAGHDIQTHVEDTRCSSEGGIKAVLKILANPRTIAILGTTCSVSAASAAKVVSENGLVMISGNNSAPFLTSIGGKRAPNWHKGYYRTASNEEAAGKAAAIFSYHHLNVRKAALINDGDIYTKGLTEGFAYAFEKTGGRVVLDSTVNKGDEDMTPITNAVRYSGADIVFFPLFQPEANRILARIRVAAGLEHLVLMSDGALIENTFIRDVKDLAMGMYFVGPARPETKAADEMSLKYIKKYKTHPSTSYYLTAFDAAQILLSAIEKAAIREKDGTLYIGRDALRNALYQTKDFRGVSGILDCDAFGAMRSFFSEYCKSWGLGYFRLRCFWRLCRSPVQCSTT